MIEKFVGELMKVTCISRVVVITPHDLRESTRKRNFVFENMPSIRYGLSPDFLKSANFLGASVVPTMIEAIVDNYASH